MPFIFYQLVIGVNLKEAACIGLTVPDLPSPWVRESEAMNKAEPVDEHVLR